MIKAIPEGYHTLTPAIAKVRAEIIKNAPLSDGHPTTLTKTQTDGDFHG